MTTKTIINDGLAAMADEQEFRRWCARFACVQQAYNGHIRVIGSMPEVISCTGSLAELAFELRALAIVKIGHDAWAAFEDIVVGGKTIRYLWQHSGSPEIWIVLAIVALEGTENAVEILKARRAKRLDEVSP